MGNNWKVCLGPYTFEARHVFIKQRKSGRESVIDAKKLRYPFLSSVNIQTLRIKDANLDPYFFDEKVQYVFLNEPIKTRVLVTQSN